MKFKKVVVIGINEDSLEDRYWAKIDSLTELRVMLVQGDKHIKTELADADCLLVWFNGVDKETIDQAPNLKYIGALATGVGKIDVAYATSKGITVTNLPGYSTEGVAELTIGVILENLRELSRAKEESKRKRTSEDGFKGREIKGKDFGVVGLGLIGERVAELANAFGAKVFYTSRSKKNNNYTHEDLDILIAHCDLISTNLSLTDETEGILNADRISKIKKGAIVVNTAPHEVFDLAALNERLSKNDLVYIFDHSDPGDISDEDLEKLRSHKNCISYPVLGYYTDEATVAKQEMFVSNLESFLDGKPVNTVK